MRPALALGIALTISATAFAADPAPSDELLAQMGLGGLQVIPDDEAATIRGAGFQPSKIRHTKLIAAIGKVQQEIHQLGKTVRKLNKHGHPAKEVRKFHKYAEDIRKAVLKYHKAVESRPHQPKSKHSGMKAPKVV